MGRLFLSLQREKANLALFFSVVASFCCPGRVCQLGRNLASSLLNSLISEDGIEGQTYSYDLGVFDSAFKVRHCLHALWALNLGAQLQGLDYVWDHDMSSPQLQSM